MRRQERFAEIPRFFSGCVYAVELANGVIKVGFSRNPRTRMGSLVTEVRKQYRCEIQRVHVGRDLNSSRQATRAELDLLRRVSRIGTPFGARREYFQNLPFRAATNLVDQVSRREYLTELDLHTGDGDSRQA